MPITISSLPGMANTTFQPDLMSRLTSQLAGLRSSSNQATQETTTEPTLPSITASQNLEAMPDISSLTEMVNALNRNAQRQANQGRIPGAGRLERQSSSNIAAGLSGQLPPDVVAMLQQQAAERGVAGTGVGTGANVNAAYLRALGLSSLDLENQAQNWLNAAYGRNPAAPIFNPATLFLPPTAGGTTTTTADAGGRSTGAPVSYVPRGATTAPAGVSTRVPSNMPGSMDWFNTLFPSNTGTYGGGAEPTTADWLSSIGYAPTPISDIDAANYDYLTGDMGYSPQEASQDVYGGGTLPQDDYAMFDSLFSE